MSTIRGFGRIEENMGIRSQRRKTSFILWKDYMKNFCTFLREHAKNIIDFETKNMLSLAKKKLKSHKDVKVCYICGKRILKEL